MKRVLVTGATGFIGRYVCAEFNRRGFTVIGGVRATGPGVDACHETRVLGNLESWRSDALGPAVAGVEIVVHLAARVHLMNDSAANPLEAFRTANVEATGALFSAAAKAGAKRFIYVSSIKAATFDLEKEEDPYGQSKVEAERLIRTLSSETGLEYVVIRPPLVYGAGVKANFLQLLRWVDRGVPLPLGSINNRRSLVFAGNLAHAIADTAEHPGAANQEFSVSDGEPLSTPNLTRGLAHALGTRARLIPVPVAVLRLMGAVTGKSKVIDRLAGSLVVDDTLARFKFGWQAPVSFEQGLRETVEWFRGSK